MKLKDLYSIDRPFHIEPKYKDTFGIIINILDNDNNFDYSDLIFSGKMYVNDIVVVNVNYGISQGLLLENGNIKDGFIYDVFDYSNNLYKQKTIYQHLIDMDYKVKEIM